MKIAWEGGIRADEELSRVLTAGLGGESAGSRFVQSFFSRELKGSLEWIAFFARSPEEALPLLGLMAWNARQLEIFLGLEGRNGPWRGIQLEKLKRWSVKWKLSEVIRLQSELKKLDFQSKQTAHDGLGSWASLSHRYCL